MLSLLKDEGVEWSDYGDPNFTNQAETMLSTDKT